MAVSLLEATSAQTASQYVPVSRTRVRTDLLARLGVDFCRTHGVLPVDEAQGTVICVTTRTRDASLQRELRQHFGRPVSLRIASEAEIQLALTALDRPIEAHDRRRVLADLLESMQVVREDQIGAYAIAADGEEYLGQALVQAGMITEDERLEAVGLAFHLPSINLDQHPPQAELDGILPADVIRSLRLIPLWALDDEFFIAVADPPTVDEMAKLTSLLGLTIRPVLVPPGQLTSRLEELRNDEENTRGDIVRAVVKADLASEAGVTAALRVAQQTGESPQEAIARVGGIDANGFVEKRLSPTTGAQPTGQIAVEVPTVVDQSRKIVGGTPLIRKLKLLRPRPHLLSQQIFGRSPIKTTWLDNL